MKLQEIGFQTGGIGEGEQSMGVKKFGKRKGGVRLGDGWFVERKRAGDEAVARRIAGGEERGGGGAQRWAGLIESGREGCGDSGAEQWWRRSKGGGGSSMATAAVLDQRQRLEQRR